MTTEPLDPKTGEPTNAARAARVAPALDAYAQKMYEDPDDRKDLEIVAQDFLTDVFHWCLEHGVDPDDVATRALRMHADEVQGDEDGN